MAMPAPPSGPEAAPGARPDGDLDGGLAAGHGAGLTPTPADGNAHQQDATPDALRETDPGAERHRQPDTPPQAGQNTTARTERNADANTVGGNGLAQPATLPASIAQAGLGSRPASVGSTGQDAAAPPQNPDSPTRAPLLQLDGFEGPLDLLLELARAQKVDLARISILALVEQYLAVVEQARAIRLELAADWLVMAAWLAWLKSRLLLPAEEGLDKEAEDAAEVLAERLEELARMVQAAKWLSARDQLGRDVFSRGASESLVEIDRSGLALDVPQLMRAYMAAVRRTAKRRIYAPRVLRFWTVQDALSRLRRLLGERIAGAPPGWSSLEACLPDNLPGETQRDPADGIEETPEERLERIRMRRAALAGTLIAGLELAKSGMLELRQDEAFGQIMLRPQEEEAP